MQHQQHNLTVGPLTINNVTQRKVSILGGTGSGKTTTLKLIALAANDCGLRVFIFDPLNVIRIEGFDKVIFKTTDVDKGKEAGKFFNQKSKKNLIFGFKKFLQKEFAQFINDFFSTFEPHDALILFDEVHEAVPESGTSAKYADEVEREWRHARNSNVGFLSTSQRPALVDKNVLGLTDFFILYRTTYPNDVAVIEKILKGVCSEEDAEAKINAIKTKPFLNGYAIDFRANEK